MKNTILELQSVHRESGDPLGIWAANYLTTQLDRITEDLNRLQALVPASSTIADIGSAPFYMAACLKRAGHNVDAIDIAPDRLIAFLEQEKIRATMLDFEKDPFPFEDDRFDLVILAEVFEHLRIDLIATMTEVHRIIKPGGLLYLSTPNFFELKKFVRLLFKGRTSDIHKAYSKLKQYGHMGHTREYTVADVADFLEKLGFEIVKTHFDGRGRTGLTKLLKWLFPFLRNRFAIIARKAK